MKKHFYIVLAALVLACAAVFMMSTPAPQEAAPPAPQASAPLEEPQLDVPSISVTELRDILQAATPVFLLDVRQPEEFDAGHLDQAVLIPLGDLPTRLAEVPKDKKIVVNCRTGKRSAQAVKLLQEQGYTDVVSLTGGIEAWNAGTMTPDAAIVPPTPADAAALAPEGTAPVAPEALSVVPPVPAAATAPVPPTGVQK